MDVTLTPELETLVQKKAQQKGLEASAYIAKLLEEALQPEGGTEARSQKGPNSRLSISARFEEIRRRAPEDAQQALRELPSDFAAEHDHYLYGTPKKYS